MTQWRVRMVTAVVLGLAPLVLSAQPFPSKPIRIIVAFPPGGGTDIVARLMAARLTTAMGQQVLVENRPGADGIPGTDLAAKAAPDGYTWLIGTAGNLSINHVLYSKVPFNIARDFAPITQVVSVDMMLTVHPSLPVKSTAELVALARAKKGALVYASTGTGGIPHLAMELFNASAKTHMVHVPYKGGSAALSDLLGGHVPMMVQSTVQGLQIVKQGKLRALALFSPKRAAVLPELPTASESLPGCVATNWYGLVVPAQTAAAVQRRIYDEAVKVLRAPDIKDLIAAQGAAVVAGSPEELGEFMKAESEKWARIIKAANIRAD